MTDTLPDDMREACDKLGGEAQDIAFSHGMRLDSDPPPSTIYHYTTDQGLRGILENGSLWVTDIFSLNDPSELKHGLQIAEEALTATAKDEPILSEFLAKEMRVMFDGNLSDMANCFVCCFSRNGNELGQWRAYADNGRGYALGFDCSILEQAFVAAGGGVRRGGLGAGPMTFPMTYDDDVLLDLQRRIVAKFVPLILAPRGRDLEEGLIQDYVSMLATNLTVVMLWASMFFKHKAYASEDEYRFLLTCEAGTRTDVRYRNRPHSLVCYLEFFWREAVASSLKEIVIGPAADPLLSRRFVNDCLNAFHYPRNPGEAVRIKELGIPYRAV